MQPSLCPSYLQHVTEQSYCKAAVRFAVRTWYAQKERAAGDKTQAISNMEQLYSAPGVG